MNRPEIGEVNIFEGVHCSKFIGHINDLENYCDWLEQELEKTKLRYRKAREEITYRHSFYPLK